MDELRSTISETKVSSAPFNLETHLMNPGEVFSLFKQMLDEDCELLYLCTRPENLLIMNIPVPPTVIRPSVLVDDSWTNENDITERLKNIVQANARLRHDLTQDLPPAYAGGFKHSWDALQVEVAQ
ncbi:hypothetical protein Prudu_009521 [Prunus dulcis]|nr:hypothetical protein Prudu_009521 [Prunus dulcis]